MGKQGKPIGHWLTHSHVGSDAIIQCLL